MLGMRDCLVFVKKYVYLILGLISLVFFVSYFQMTRVHLLLHFRNHLDQLFFTTVPLYFGPLPLVDLLPILLQLLLSAGYLVIKLSLSSLLLLELTLQGFVLRLQPFSLVHNAVNALPYRLHLLL